MTVVNEQWDYLILLDACRYDYFEAAWRDYFSQGRLECRTSVGTCTNEWRDKTFPGFYEDIVYITANPQICAGSPVFGYTAGDHFGFIHEIWRQDWDETHGTVLPEVVSRRALEIIPQYSEKRFIIHYLQPHAPYIKAPYGANLRSLKEFTDFLENPMNQTAGRRFRQTLLRRLLPYCRNKRLFTNHPEWVLRKWLGIPPKGPMEIAWRQLGVDGLRQAYNENLRLALEQVRTLVGQLTGTIVITSDHGELLGEDGQFAHPQGSDHPAITQVPWLVIEKAKSAPAAEPTSPAQNVRTESANDEEIIKRLRALGYHD
ncbi:MAG: sulfatase-like hydrolase/transferase [Planctomycetaceae bacterium]|nr:sulfatase-like hydrolase/transferase [Planctomycetaceae bacterium]